MRNAFAAELTELAAADERIVFLSGDIGNRLFNDFKDQFPDRFFNCGVAEASMTGMAAGLALAGLKPITYTIASFNTYRCFEQIRVDVCYHNLPVIIVGVGAGLSYAANGPTHHSCEDIACLRSLPNMTVICPADKHETRSAFRAALDLNGPVYLRLGKKGEPDVYDAPPPFTIGKGVQLRAGRDAALVATGTIMPMALEIVDRFAEKGVQIELINMPTIKPLDEGLLRSLFEKFPVVATLEEHSRIGGLGGAVAEWRCDQVGSLGRLVRFGTQDFFLSEAGEQEHARERHGLSVSTLMDQLGTIIETASQPSTS